MQRLSAVEEMNTPDDSVVYALTASSHHGIVWHGSSPLVRVQVLGASSGFNEVVAGHTMPTVL